MQTKGKRSPTRQLAARYTVMASSEQALELT